MLNHVRRKRYDDIKIVRQIPNLAPNLPCQQMRWLCRQPDGFVVWDTETTGLDDDSKIVSIGIVDETGKVLLNTLINPGVPIPADATAIHGVTDDMVADAPTFAEVYPAIRQALQGRRWCIYNKAYDIPRLEYEVERHFLPTIQPKLNTVMSNYGFYQIDYRDTHCIMEAFAEFYGDFNDYFQSYTWKSLSVATSKLNIKAPNAHNALADALATLEVIKAMALNEDNQN